MAQLSGLILTGRVGKHTDSLAQELVTSTEGKTDCKEWGTDGWQGYGRVLPSEVEHYISKALTQRLERTNGILRQQTGRWLSLRHATRTTTKQVWQVVEPDTSYPTFGHQLLQLDMATFVPGNYSGTPSRVN